MKMPGNNNGAKRNIETTVLDSSSKKKNLVQKYQPRVIDSMFCIIFFCRQICISVFILFNFNETRLVCPGELHTIVNIKNLCLPDADDQSIQI